jgi:hypothetical protein
MHVSNRRSLLLALAACVFAPAAAFAHHSRAAYDQSKEVVIDGTVTDLAWKNPHIYLTIETKGPDGAPVLQEIEAASVSGARGMGLPMEAIAPGAHVVVRANPSRFGPGARASGLDVETADGAVYPLNTDANVGHHPAATAKARGLAGRWAPTVASFNKVIPSVPSWPYTEVGKAALAEAMSRIRDPGAAVLGICKPFPPPLLSVFPDLRTIEVSDKTVVMRFEGQGVTQERVVHMDEAAHPAQVAPSLMGHSIGRWEGETLVIDTVAFAPHPLGLFFVRSGPSKHLRERLTLAEDRLHLQYEVTLEDPEIFTKPVTYMAIWDYRPDLEPSGVACDPETARRGLAKP